MHYLPVVLNFARAGIACNWFYSRRASHHGILLQIVHLLHLSKRYSCLELAVRFCNSICFRNLSILSIGVLIFTFGTHHWREPTGSCKNELVLRILGLNETTIFSKLKMVSSSISCSFTYEFLILAPKCVTWLKGLSYCV